MSQGPKFKYERRYPYTCSGCMKKRWTRKYDRRADQLCTKCEREGAPNENQIALFDPQPVPPSEVPGTALPFAEQSTMPRGKK